MLFMLIVKASPKDLGKVRSNYAKYLSSDLEVKR